uniref:Eukaryotic translation initiation factor 2A n=1 Tax=Phallusia mammillata TaxID=59560 RepID=A0A6F9DBL4_9ASCI|nr:eukaryotic translation initiation factor 2A [Phallusia mammillata]
MDGMLPLFSVRGSEGLLLKEWCLTNKELTTHIKLCEKPTKIIAFSSDGQIFVWCDGVNIYVYQISTKSIIHSFIVPRAYDVSFSPLGDLFCTWEPYAVTKENPSGSNNCKLWNIEDGECVFSYVQKKKNCWEPVWLKGTHNLGRLVGSSVHFFQDNNFGKIVQKMHMDKLESFKVSPNSQPPHRVACFIRGAKGAPSSVRVFEYPKFSADDVVANKSFFKADSVDILWNNRGTELLVKTTVDVDTTGESYYGEQSLHYMSASGETAIVSLSKKGPIYDAKWSPNSNQFCVVFGFMPAKACIFNRKCNMIFEFSPTPKNECFYNPQGNLLVLAGFGNLRGNIEIWDCDRKKQVSQYTSPDTTLFEWCSDGVHFLTATTAPRLRVSNGYKLWHYLDGVLYEESVSTELHQVLWQPKPEGTYPVPVIKDVSKSDLMSKVKADTPTAYVPPHARGKTEYTAAKERFVKDDDAPVTPENHSKAAQKNKKKRENKKKAGAPPPNLTNEQQDVVQMAKYLLTDSSIPQPTSESTNPNDKKIKNLKKKLQAIEKLKQQQAQGKELEKNQVEKLKTEDSLLQELSQLQLKS